jgi:hypothetical protein
MQQEYLKYYEKILEYCSSKKAWIISGEKIWNWWSSHVEQEKDWILQNTESLIRIEAIKN